MSKPSPTPQNRLGRETSPYLLQHKDNPVHWWAWGPEALAEARRTGKPILLSIGYAACHWCHVMAHESFEDPATAAQMNDLFVNIKVDREERPDVDAIYMRALQSLDQRGGWPLTMFLDSEARPFWGGTYFPPEPRFGQPAFRAVLAEVARVYREEPDKVQLNARHIVQALSERGESGAATSDLTDAGIAALAGPMVRAVDMRRGGLAGAPKFPQWSYFWLLWRLAIRYGNPAALQAVDTTLTNICQGGVYDHLGGGFARYAVDERWLVPHFEKMLGDNALLIDLMTEVYRETGSELYKARIAETVEWLRREMIAEGGGFAASLDADSEGEEGKFYVWSKAEIEDALDADDARLFCEVYDVTAEGNWEGHAILNRLGAPELRSPEEEEALAAMRAKLLARRAGRVRPGWDDKVLADWNGLMIAALAHAARVFDRADWLDLAKGACDFVLARMEQEGRLLHSYRDGRAHAPATASDYANMIWGALRLYLATDDTTYLGTAERWTAVVDEHYWVGESGGYAFTADDTPDLIVRLRAAHDDAVPNANGVMLSNLVALHLLTGKPRYLEWAGAIPRAFAADLKRNTFGHCGLIAGMLDLIAPQHVVVIEPGEKGVARGRSPLARAMLDLSLPGAVEHAVAQGQAPLNPALAGKGAAGGKPTAYACLGPQCSPPVTEPEALVELLRQQRTARFATTGPSPSPPAS